MSRFSYEIVAIAYNERQLLTCVAKDILLDDFNRVCARLSNDSDMPIFRVCENKQVVRTRFLS